MANPIKSFRESLGKIPTKYRFWLSLGVLAALLIALPITLIGLMTGTFELRKRAVTAEPTPTLGPGQVRIYVSTSTHRIGDGGIVTISLNNDSGNNIDLIQLFMTFDPRIINFSESDVELWMGAEADLKEVFHASGDKAQLRLAFKPSNHSFITVAFIRYKPVAPGVTSLIFEKDLKTGTLENKVTAVGSDANIIEELRNGSVQITGIFDKCGESCGSDNDCSGLVCGTPCPEGQVCAQYLRCYNANCPYDDDCNCFDVVPITPSPVPCGQEGEVIPVYPGYQCCPGLEAISPNKPDANGNCPYPLLGASICVKDCGDGQCTLGENKCNCPEDCVHNSLRIKLRFGGVTSRPPDDSNKEIQIYATNLTGGPNLGSATDKKLITLEVDDSGVYHGEITPTSTFFGHRYRLRIKGPKHLQSVFPDVFFQAGGELDLTDWPLRPGDLDQDGDVDINDLRAIKVFSTNPADIAFGDLNFDNKLSVLDRVLILNTLSVQYDPD